MTRHFIVFARATLLGLLIATFCDARAGAMTNAETKMRHVAHKTGEGIRHGAEKTRDGIERGAQAAGRGIRRAAHAVDKGVRKGVEKTGEGISKVGKRLRPSADKST
jgi:hypothetical protein